MIGEPGPDQVVITLRKHTGKRAELGITCRREIPIVRPESLQKTDAGDTVQP